MATESSMVLPMSCTSHVVLHSTHSNNTGVNSLPPWTRLKYFVPNYLDCQPKLTAKYCNG